MATTQNTPRLGDTVSGFYMDVPFVGKLVSFTGAGFSVDCKGAPIMVMGRVTDSVWLKNTDSNRAQLRIVAAGPELDEDDVVYQPGFSMYCLRAGL